MRGGVGAGVILEVLKLLHSNITSWFPPLHNIFGKLQTPVNRHTTIALAYFRKSRKMTSFLVKGNSRTSDKLKKIFNVSDFLFWNSEYFGWWLANILSIVITIIALTCQTEPMIAKNRGSLAFVYWSPWAQHLHAISFEYFFSTLTCYVNLLVMKIW